MEQTTIARDNDLDVDAYHNSLSHPKTLVFCNAVGLSATLAARLSEWLDDQGIGFVTWHSRGTPGNYDENFRGYDAKAHINDMLSVVSHFRLEEYVLMGWCSGCEVALHASIVAPQGLKKLLLVNPFFSFREQCSTPLGSGLYNMARSIAKTETKGRFYYSLIERAGNDAKIFGLDPADPLLPLLAAPFKEGEDALVRYAHILANITNNGFEDWAREVRVPAVLVGGDRDPMVNLETLERARTLLERSEVRLVPDSDHYWIFTREVFFRLLRDEVSTEQWGQVGTRSPRGGAESARPWKDAGAGYRSDNA